LKNTSLFYSKITFRTSWNSCRTSNLWRLLVQRDLLKTNVIIEISPHRLVENKCYYRDLPTQTCWNTLLYCSSMHQRPITRPYESRYIRPGPAVPRRDLWISEGPHILSHICFILIFFLVFSTIFSLFRLLNYVCYCFV
jgi:hypothetical protein